VAKLTTNMSNNEKGVANKHKDKYLNGEHPIEKIAQNTGETLGAMATDIANTTADSMKSSREYVKENPVKGVTMAVVAGVATGSLLTMAMRSGKN
jgi:ElaB/YqjD/DUF883 family membrane-anchored ribosome-binding protein